MKILKLLAVLIAVWASRSVMADAGCSFTFDTASSQFTSAGGSGSVAVAASDANCSWTAISFSPYVTITSGQNYTGNGVVTYSVPDNTNRVGFTSVLVIAGQIYLVNQDTFSVPPGKYNGVVIQANEPTHAGSGSIKLELKSTGTFSSSLTMGGVRTKFKGRFDGTGYSTNTIARKNMNSLALNMNLDIFSGASSLTGTMSDGVFTSAVFAGVNSANRTNRCPFKGQYTFVLAPADSSDPAVPQGYGYGTLTVNKNGSANLVGVLGDGTKISTSVPMSFDGDWPLYKPLYNNKGSCVGLVPVSTNGAFDATVDWFKPPVPADHFYPAGFTTAVQWAGATFVSPTSGGPSMAGSGTLTLGGGNLTSTIVKSVLVDSNGVVTVTPPGADEVTVEFNPLTGEFTGSFLDPALGQTFEFTGQLVQTNHFGAGFFRETSRCGFVTIDLAP